MTIPGPIIEPSVPSKGGVGRTREPAAKGDVEGREKDAGFGDLLSKLQGNDGRSSEASGPPRDAGQSAERAWSQNADAQLAPSGVPDLSAAAGGNVAGMPEAGLPSHRPGPEAVAMGGVAAAMGLAPAPPAGDGRVDASPRAPVQPATGTGEAALDAQSQAARERAAQVLVDDVAPDIEAGRQSRVAEQAPASIAASAATVRKDKSGDPAQTSAPTADAPLFPVRDAAPAAQAPELSAARSKASVVRQETHFAPASAPAPAPPQASGAGSEPNKPTTVEAMGGEAAASVDAAQPSLEGSPAPGVSPARQIADRIAAEAAAAPASAGRAGAAPEQPGMTPVLKSLHIALQPSDLGTVTIRMEIRHAELTLHVEAERPETAELIRNDQDSLLKLLRSAGYAIDAGAVRVEADRSAMTQNQNGTQTNLQSSPQSQSGASERQGQGQRGSAGPHQGNDGTQASRKDAHETTPVRAGAGLYV